MTQTKRPPTLFDVNDTTLTIKEQTNDQAEQSEHPAPHPRPAPTNTPFSKRLFSLSFWLLTSLAGLVMIWASIELISSIQTLITKNTLLGQIALALLIIALTTFFALIIREISGLWQLKKLGQFKTQAEQAYNDNKLKPAKKHLANIKALYENQPNRAWMLDRLQSYENEIMDGREMVELIDREIGKPLDEEARATIAASAKKVSLITAIAPGPILDMMAVALINLSMIRKIANIYGGRPGFWGQMRLSRNILAHLALSGGIALTSDLLQPLIGTSIAAKLSKKLGEGLFNGALTIRIGLSAADLTRPIPHISTKPLTFKELTIASFNPKTTEQST